MQLLDLSSRRNLGILTHFRVKGARRVVLQLLLPGIDLVRVNLIPRRQIGDRRFDPLRGSNPQRFQGNLRLQRRINLPSRLRRHHPLRLSRQNGTLPTTPLVPFPGASSHREANTETKACLQAY
jgi:hypothetical protein